MLLVREVSGPVRATVGQRVTYRVETFNKDDVGEEESARVSWLIKTVDGADLAHFRAQGPVLEMEVPGTWSGVTAMAMPFMNSPTMRIAIQTEIAAAPFVPSAGEKQVEVAREAKRFYASVDGEPRFYVGTDVRYGSRRGLMNLANPPGPRYRPEDFETQHGDWAWYLLPTITCESRGFYTCLNTYDRARFTFGHLQFAAHTPNDNFTQMFREMLGLPLAAGYFPDLTLHEDRIHLRADGGLEPLETADSTQGLMDYFNPFEEEVDEQEADKAARMVDWCVRDPAFRKLQVAFGVRHQQAKLERHAQKLPLDGLLDKVCLVILDVLHQGRASYRSIKSALQGADPFEALLSLGLSTYRERIATLRAGIRDLEERDRVGFKVYSRASKDFVMPPGA